MILGIISFLLFMFAIFSHELGHMFTAKHFGVDVDSFTIGLGPKLLSKRIKGTTYSLALIPLGGTCNIDEEQFATLPLLKQCIVYIAGVTVNYFVAIIFTSVGYIGYQGSISKIVNTPYLLIKIFYQTGACFLESLSAIFDSKALIETGGMIDLFGTFSSTAASMSSDFGKQLSLVIFLIGVMSFLLMMFNLLPIPPLDGGLIASALIRRFIFKDKPVPIFEKSVQFITIIVIAFFICSAVLSEIGDVIHLFS